jgi:hypothetical protein
MFTYFSEDKWDRLIKDPVWYAGALWTEYDALMQRAEHDPTHRDAIKKEIRTYFADRLDSKAVALAQNGEDLDRERKPIDTLVVHHTSGAASNYTLSYLNAVQLLRIYAPTYRNGQSHDNQPIWSGHFYQGQQVFWGYHWFIFENGAYTRILGICFAGNFMEQPPNSAMLAAAQHIIHENYQDPTIRIIGHYEAPRDTTCPGATFGQWRQLLRP